LCSLSFTNSHRSLIVLWSHKLQNPVFIMTSRYAAGNKIVQIALTFVGSSVYGGWIRDNYVRNDDFNDIDIRFTTIHAKAQFVDLLSILFKIKVITDVYGSGHIHSGNRPRTMISVMVEGTAIIIDCGVVACGEISQTDFTCNALVLTKHGLNCCGLWRNFMKCMTHVKEKQFSVIKHCDESYSNLYCSNIITRANKLVNNGWEMVKDEESFCILPIPPKEVCSICLTVVFPDSAIQTVCMHYFHVGCLTSYLQSKSAGHPPVSCPNCRLSKFII
jgi:hypothetical protein